MSDGTAGLIRALIATLAWGLLIAGAWGLWGWPAGLIAISIMLFVQIYE